MSSETQCQSHGHPQAEPGQLEFSMSAIRKKILVLSGKGGVGKSTVAVNLAVELARKGHKVGLLDVDLHGPSVPGMMGMGTLKCRGDQQNFTPLEAPNHLKVMSVAFLIEDDSQAVIWRGPMKHSVIEQLLAHTQWGPLDYLVVDAPPGTGDEPLAVAQLVGDNAGAVIVTTPQKVAVADVRRCITFCQQLTLPIWGVVENMSGMSCPHCQQMIDLYQPDGGKNLAAETGLNLLGCIPIDTGIAYGGDEGLSISDCSVTPQVHNALDGIVENLLAQMTAKGNKTMKIAIPVAGDKLCMHFGHCEKFALVDVDPDSKTITGRQDLTPPPHEPGVLPKWLHEQGANCIIAGGMGQRAQQLFTDNQIDVIVGAASETPEALVTAYLSGSLQTGQNVCDH